MTSRPAAASMPKCTLAVLTGRQTANLHTAKGPDMFLLHASQHRPQHGMLSKHEHEQQLFLKTTPSSQIGEGLGLAVGLQHGLAKPTTRKLET